MQHFIGISTPTPNYKLYFLVCIVLCRTFSLFLYFLCNVYSCVSFGDGMKVEIFLLLKYEIRKSLSNLFIPYLVVFYFQLGP